jgi:hypothetical protein
MHTASPAFHQNENLAYCQECGRFFDVRSGCDADIRQDERARIRRELLEEINQWLSQVLDGGFDFDRAMGAKAACSAVTAALDWIAPEEEG